MKPIRLAEDTIDKADLVSLIAWLETSPWLSKGSLTVRFEDNWAEWLGTQFAVFCNSGSSANLLMYAAAQAYLDDPAPRCIVPAVSWATTVAPAIQLGYHPIMCDADPDTWGMNIEHLTELVEQYHPDVVMIVHTVGCPNRMEPILALKEEYGFFLLEDCCSAYGSTYRGQRVGAFGDMSSASYYFAHQMSCASSTPIPYIDEHNRFHIDSIEQVYQQYRHLPNSIRVAAYDNDYVFKYVRPSRIIQHRLGSKRMLKLTLETGRTVVVTEDHSVFRWDCENLCVRPTQGRDIQVGDYLAAPRHIPAPDEQVEMLDFLGHCQSHDPDRFFVRGFARINLKNVKGTWHSREERKRSNYSLRGAMPLSSVTDTSGDLKIGLRRQRRYTYVPAHIPVTPSVARFLGFFVAEGSYLKRGISFSFDSREVDYINDVVQTGRECFGLEARLEVRPEIRRGCVHFDSASLRILLEEYLGVQRGARNKRIPELVFHFHPDCQRAFLYGFFRGDGTKDFRRTSVASSSASLINDTAYLCQMLGITGNVYRKTKPGDYNILGRPCHSTGTLAFNINRLDFVADGSLTYTPRHRKGSPSQGQAVPMSPALHSFMDPHRLRVAQVKTGYGGSRYETTTYRSFNRSYKRMSMQVLEAHTGSWVGTVPALRRLRDGDLCLLKVRKIEEITPESEYVYDFEVPELENFVGGFQPVCLHNSTIEGGMVSTDNPQLRDLLLMLRSHGWARDLSPDAETALAQEHQPIPFNRIFTFYYPGFNVRSTDLQAQIGLSQLLKLDVMVQTRIRNHRAYQDQFRARLPEFGMQTNGDAEICSISFAALAPDAQTRERVGQALRSQAIETRPLGGGSMGRQPFWATRYGVQPLPVADRLHECAFMVPNHHRLSLEDVDTVVDAVRRVGVDG